MSAAPLQTIKDTYMQEMLAKTRQYTILLLNKGPKYDLPGADKIIWEHGRRNFELRRDGKLCIVCPILDESSVRGVCIFATDPEETKRIYDEDPAVKAGIFVFDILSTRSFPGDSLPSK
jgi:hypothetical protein